MLLQKSCGTDFCKNPIFSLLVLKPNREEAEDWALLLALVRHLLQGGFLEPCFWLCLEKLFSPRWWVFPFPQRPALGAECFCSAWSCPEHIADVRCRVWFCLCCGWPATESLLSLQEDKRGGCWALLAFCEWWTPLCWSCLVISGLEVVTVSELH